MTSAETITELESYWERWNERKRRPYIELHESEARRRHEAWEEYAVVLGNGEVPLMVITLHLKMRSYVEVQFLDRNLLPKYTYLFGSHDDDAGREGQVFLDEVYEKEYDQEGKVIRLTHVRSWPDGRMVMRKKNNGDAEEGWSKEPQSAEELERHWEPVPAFGDWDSIIRFDRQTAVS